MTTNKNPSAAEIRDYMARCKTLGLEPKNITDEFGNVLPDVFGHGAELQNIIAEAQKKAQSGQ